MTATVSFTTSIGQPVIAVPLQALLVEGGATHAWVVDPSSQTVRRTRVQVSNVAGNEIVLSEGLKPGDVIVTAGVNQLKDGQKGAPAQRGNGTRAGGSGDAEARRRQEGLR